MKENSLRVEVQLVYRFDKVESVNYYCQKIVQVIIQQRESLKSNRHIDHTNIQSI